MRLLYVKIRVEALKENNIGVINIALIKIIRYTALR
jgi:hypothetical protein